MKRPFALIGITYLSVQAALFYLESDLAAAILTAVCFIGTIVSLFILKNRNLRHSLFDRKHLRKRKKNVLVLFPLDSKRHFPCEDYL